jgi:magnesium chelatase subunit D
MVALAVAPVELGGARLCGPAGPDRKAWLDAFQGLLPGAAPCCKLPAHAGDDALDGGLDWAATLASGRRVHQAGVLARAQGGVIQALMAERLSPARAAKLAGALDDPQRQWALLALDESHADEPGLSHALGDRLAFALHPEAGRQAPKTPADGRPDPHPDDILRGRIAAARVSWRQVSLDEASLTALLEAAAALGVDSARAAWFAVTTARVLAALRAAPEVHPADLALSAALTLAHRATRQPAASSPSGDETDDRADSMAEDADETAQAMAEQTAKPGTDPQPAPENTATHDPDDGTSPGVHQAQRLPPNTPQPGPRQSQPLPEQVLQAAQAAMPAGLLARLQAERSSAPARRVSAGRVGQATQGGGRGRLLTARPGSPRGGARLALLETLRAAAPWQRLRREAMAGPASGTAAGTCAQASAQAIEARRTAAREEARADAYPHASADARTHLGASRPSGAGAPPSVEPPPRAPRLLIRREDLRVQRRQHKRATTTIFAIDASGSQALHRLAEAKGAVELLLADCYARRDKVAVIGFRGRQAQLLLEPTRSLVRAKRSLAGLPGGGGTPLAMGIEAATRLAQAVCAGGGTPLVVLLTDGKANIGSTGEPGRAAAVADALRAARAHAASGTATLLIDTAPASGVVGTSSAITLAAALRARCLSLPHAGAQRVCSAIQAARTHVGDQARAGHAA